MSSSRARRTGLFVAGVAFSVGLYLAAFFVLGLPKSVVYAGSCSYYDNGCGFFYQEWDGAGNFVIPSGVYTTNAGAFTSFIARELDAGGTRNLAASYIVLTMLGYGEGEDPLDGSDDDKFAKWSSIVSQYAAAGRIDFNYAYPWDCGQTNTYMQNIGDVAQLITGPEVRESNPCGPGVTVQSIVFKDARGRVIYAIKKNCGNPIGDLDKLPPIEAYLDGVNIDDSGTGKYGGNLIPSGAVKVSVSDAGSDSRNPFNFDNSSGGGDAIPAGNRTVSINSAPPGWVVLGYSICKDGGSCDSAWLSSNITGGGAKSFRFNFAAGVRYHMRWMFQQIKASCVTHTLPPLMIVGTPTTFTVTSSLTFWDSSQFSAGNNPALKVQVRGPGSTAPFVLDMTIPKAGYTVSGSKPATVTSSVITFTPPAPGTYYMQWSLGGGGIAGATCPSTNDGNWSNPAQGDAGYAPYFTSTGGDILSADNTANAIKSWNGDNQNGLGYAGAGSQMAALARGDISSFVTGTGLSSFGAGSGLAFANTTASGTKYGGGYTVPVFVPGGIPAASKPLPTGSLSNLTTGVYTQSGDVSIDGTLKPGQNVTIYVTSGNVRIAGNINYAPYGNLSQVPRLTVIVQNGNIYVDSAVTELHGVFSANGGSASGNFYSCSTGFTPVDMKGDNYATCNHKLTVYGSVAANKLVLSRTYGNLVAAGAVPAQPAEDFVFSPELWLALPPNAGGLNTPGFASYISLPPVL